VIADSFEDVDVLHGIVVRREDGINDEFECVGPMELRIKRRGDVRRQVIDSARIEALKSRRRRL
jgi:hypothetical protein